MTAQELLALPDDGQQSELVRGELVVLPFHSAGEGRVIARLAWSIGAHVNGHDLGDVFLGGTGCILARDPDTVRAPDIALVASHRLPLADEDGFLPFAPDLVVEAPVIEETFNYILEKVLQYLDAGARMVVVVVPRREVLMVYGPDRVARVLGVGDVFDGGDVLPGFRLAVGEIFE